MFWKDFLYLCLSWPAALEHGKIDENTVNSCFFQGFEEIRALENMFNSLAWEAPTGGKMQKKKCPLEGS